MIAGFLLLFIGGLAGCVHTILFGIERTSATGSPARPSYARAWLAIGCAVFGATGYLVFRTGAPLVVAIVAASATGGIAGVAVAGLFRGSRRDEANESTEASGALQGHFAHVVSDIAQHGSGVVAFELEGVRQVRQGKSVD